MHICLRPACAPVHFPSPRVPSRLDGNGSAHDGLGWHALAWPRRLAQEGRNPLSLPPRAADQAGESGLGVRQSRKQGASLPARVHASDLQRRATKQPPTFRPVEPAPRQAALWNCKSSKQS